MTANHDREVLPAGVTPAVVLFDLDNTLIDRVAAFRSWASAFVVEHGLGGEVATLVLEQVDRDGFLPRADFFEDVRAHFGLTTPIATLLRDYGTRYPQCVTPPPPATFAALQMLRDRGWRVGVVTNGAPTQATKFAAAKLTEILDGWVISEVVGLRKPDPGIFAAAARACGATLDGGWMVGDSPEADIAGAVNCGLRSIWIRRGRDWPVDAFRPDAIVDTIPEAVAHLLGEAPN